MSSDFPIEGSSVKNTESRFTIDPDNVKPVPNLNTVKGWLRENIAEVIESDVTDNPLVRDGISVTLRMYSARGRKPC